MSPDQQRNEMRRRERDQARVRAAIYGAHGEPVFGTTFMPSRDERAAMGRYWNSYAKRLREAERDIYGEE
jgi:hypothetical protein